MRLDKFLFEKGYFQSRQAAKDHIDAELVSVNSKTSVKASLDVDENADIKIIGRLHEFVSRGGLKLKAALEFFGVNVSDMIAIDIGASTGGFTDCLLKNGASEVYAVDSGRDQLNPTLLRDERVHSYESMNARYLDEDTFPTKFDIAVMDVSFISQTLLYKSVSNVLKENGIFISLIKPQFEAGKKFIGKGGIVVKDKAVYESVIKNVCYEASKHGLSCQRIAESPILGKDGNKEFLALFVSTGNTEATVPEISGSKG
jgi:23S rRNA (cytidine1920-2'-O)/16S rRNA (cytidine1409-2'-O)-methyltransferase